MKAYEDCNAEEQAGWAVGHDEFLNGDLPGDDLESFLKHLCRKLAFQCKSDDFINGAQWGAQGES